MEHNWRSGFTTQSGIHVSHGENSTEFICENCKKGFEHYYHQETFDEAIKRAGINSECK